MRRLVVRVVAAGALVLCGAAVLLALPLAAPARRPAPPPVPADEQARTIEALKPPKRSMPVVAVLALNEGTEVTDFLIPYSVLRQSRLAEVTAVAVRAGPITLFPALKARPQQTTRDFDARHPDGADYVLVPAMQPRDDPAVIAWIRAQSDKGATIVSLCNGALTLGAAGLLDGRSATAHWNDIADLRRDVPTMRWVADRRYVVDRGVATSTGVSASIPVSLAIVEAIGGRARATALAQELGVADWDARHDSAAYRIDRAHAGTATRNRLALWEHETVGVPLEHGVDEIALALTADAWSRTWRSRVVSVGKVETLTTRRGLQVIPDTVADGARVDRMLARVQHERPALALDTALAQIARRYDEPTAAFVALQLEYPLTR